MCPKIIYILVSYVIFADGSPAHDPRTVVDQSQTGDVNVEVSLKNLEIIAVLNGGREQYTDYDYNYDYSEMTIKPNNKTSTASPLNETSTSPSDSTLQAETVTKPADIPPNPGTSEYALTSSIIDAILYENVTSATLEVSSPPTPTAAAAAAVTTAAAAAAVTTAAVSSSEDTATDLKECRKGFHRNKKGECELKLKPSSTNALLKLVELSQRLKLRRAN